MGAIWMFRPTLPIVATDEHLTICRAFSDNDAARVVHVHQDCRALQFTAKSADATPIRPDEWLGEQLEWCGVNSRPTCCSGKHRDAPDIVVAREVVLHRLDTQP